MKKKGKFSKAYAARVREAMKGQGLDAYSLAGQVKVQKRTVDSWLKGETLPPKEQEIALADTLNVSLDWLAGRASR